MFNVLILLSVACLVFVALIVLNNFLNGYADFRMAKMKEDYRSNRMSQLQGLMATYVGVTNGEGTEAFMRWLQTNYEIIDSSTTKPSSINTRRKTESTPETAKKSVVEEDGATTTA